MMTISLSDYSYLVERHAKKWNNTSVTDIDDYRQVGYLALMKAAHRFKTGYFVAYASRIINNDIAAYYKRHNKKITGKMEVSKVAYFDYDNCVDNEAMSCLDDKERKILDYHVGGSSVREIGRLMNLSYSRIYRILKQIKVRLRKYYE